MCRTVQCKHEGRRVVVTTSNTIKRWIKIDEGVPEVTNNKNLLGHFLFNDIKNSDLYTGHLLQQSEEISDSQWEFLTLNMAACGSPSS